MTLADFMLIQFPIGFSKFKGTADERREQDPLDWEIDLDTSAPDGEYEFCDSFDDFKSMDGKIVVKDGKIALYPTLTAIASNFADEHLKNRVVQRMVYKELPEPNGARFFEIGTAT